VCKRKINNYIRQKETASEDVGRLEGKTGVELYNNNKAEATKFHTNFECISWAHGSSQD
jgi:hypothetical protein